ncbi:MAG: HugZ family pyridoxamine 5'-phosphate oxidase [Ostreibacterium sp.]
MNQTVEKLPSEKIDENNKVKFDRYNKSKGKIDAQNIYRTIFAGEMATIGRKKSRVADYPFSSVTPFIIDHTGSPVIYTANLAEHTKNALANGRASLMMHQVQKQHCIETGWRLTCVGDLFRVLDEDCNRVAETYFRYYPKARTYNKVHDFYFFRLNITVARVIMGFGKISWVEAKDLAIPSPFTNEEEKEMIEHMNTDHQTAIEHYLTQMKVKVTHAKKSPHLVAINQFGATISYRRRLHFLAFDSEAKDSMMVRKQLVRLAKS